MVVSSRTASPVHRLNVDKSREDSRAVSYDICRGTSTAHSAQRNVTAFSFRRQVVMIRLWRLPTAVGADRPVITTGVGRQARCFHLFPLCPAAKPSANKKNNFMILVTLSYFTTTMTGLLLRAMRHATRIKLPSMQVRSRSDPSRAACTNDLGSYITQMNY